MKKRIACLLWLLCMALGSQAQSSRPNIVFILVDDLRWDALGCTGHPFVKTPHIDRIGKEGAIFQNAFVTTSLCSPSRASYLTGQYAHTHQIVGNERRNAVADSTLVTFPMRLQQGGYETAFIGKWHMDAHARPRPGFHHWISFRGQGVYHDPLLNINGQEVKKNGYITDILSEEAAAFIGKPRTKPFMLYLSHKAVHGPFTPAERHQNQFTEVTLTHRPNAQADLTGKPALQQPRKNATPLQASAKNDTIRLNQLRALLAIDEGVGKVLQALEATNQLENTLVLFTSDNGYFWGEHWLGDKRAAYEESIRVPFLARFPRNIRAGTQITPMVLNVDLAPTLLESAGIPVPAAMHGKSWLPLLKGKTTNWRKAALFEYFEEERYNRIPTYQAVRTERWKYIHYPSIPDADELYDLPQDPYEQKNLIGDKSRQAVREELQAELRKQLSHTRPVAVSVPPR